MEFSTVFPSFPTDLREALERSYREILSNFIHGKFEPSELNGGKFAEAVYRLLEWYTDPSNSYTPIGTSIRNFKQSNRKFEPLSSFPDSIRFHIPEIIVTMYTIRNKRGVGHLGGDVNPNFMDSSLILSMAKWVLGELVRIFYVTTLDKAQVLVDSITVKKLPIIWAVEDKRRILNTSLKYTRKTLVILYYEYPKSCSDRELFSWCEYSSLSPYRRNVLAKLHNAKMIEYNRTTGVVVISPLGIKYVESNIDLMLNE